MRRAIVLWVLVTGACEPDVAINTYFCGPSRSCPPGQACHDPSYTCGEPAQVERFSCPDGSQDAEPDDTHAQAIDLGQLACGEFATSERLACVGSGSDVDVYRFEHAALCERNNTALVAINFPAAFVHLRLEVVDGGGAPVASGEDCTLPNDASGRLRVCAEVELEVGEYFVEISPRVGEGLDCSGDCAANDYELDVFLPP